MLLQMLIEERGFLVAMKPCKGPHRTTVSQWKLWWDHVSASACQEARLILETHLRTSYKPFSKSEMPWKYFWWKACWNSSLPSIDQASLKEKFSFGGQKSFVLQRLGFLPLLSCRGLRWIQKSCGKQEKAFQAEAQIQSPRPFVTEHRSWSANALNSH